MKKIILLLVTLSLLFFCKHSKDGIERYMEDGAEVIVNHLEPYKIKKESSTLHLEEEFMIDFEREDLTEIGIKEIVGFDVDSDRNIYFRLSSSSENYIYKFDDKGDFLFSFGRKGQGPGELESPRYLRVNKLDQIVVSDNRRNKLLLFEKNGDFIKGISLAPNYQIATLIEKGKILVMKRSFNQEEGKFDFPVICLYLDYNVWKISRALIYVGNYGQGYEFLIYDTEGNLSRKIRKEYHKVKVPDQVKDKIVNWLSENFDSFEKVKNKIYFPEFYPPFQFFFLDEKGRLYVMTYERGKSPNGFLYDIFNPDGLFIGRIELDNYGNLATSPIINPLPLDVVAKNNRLYCLREKESGFKELVVYQMRWE